MEKQEALKNVCKIFNDFQIPFALIGAYAVAAWGIPRSTKDIDFIAEIPLKKAQKLIKKLQTLGFKTALEQGAINDPVSGVIKLSYTDNETEESIDILLGIKKLPKEIYKRTINLSIFGIKIPVISAQDLIIAKLLAGNPLDIEDAKNIFKVMKGKIDLGYIKNFCETKKIKFSL